MARRRPPPEKKYFTVAEANAALPLVRAIVRDIAELARTLQDRYERLARIRPTETARLGEPYHEEIVELQEELERDRERMQEYEQELQQLGIELKDHQQGLLDFPCWMDDREVFLCWKLGEPRVAYWHELDAGFAGRQRLAETVPVGSSPEKRT